MTDNEPGRSMHERLDAEWLEAMRQELGADPTHPSGEGCPLSGPGRRSPP